MSGIEFVALVPACIAAYAAIATEYRAWRDRRADRKSRKRNTELQKTLSGSGRVVQSRYDDGYLRLGRAFERGDDIGTSELTRHVLVLQSSVISLLTGQRDNLVHLVHPLHDSIHNSSTTVLDGILTTLAQQYQRLEQAKPLPRSLPSAPQLQPLPQTCPAPALNDWRPNVQPLQQGAHRNSGKLNINLMHQGSRPAPISNTPNPPTALQSLGLDLSNCKPSALWPHNHQETPPNKWNVSPPSIPPVPPPPPPLQNLGRGLSNCKPSALSPHNHRQTPPNKWNASPHSVPPPPPPLQNLGLNLSNCKPNALSPHNHQEMPPNKWNASPPGVPPPPPPLPQQLFDLRLDDWKPGVLSPHSHQPLNKSNASQHSVPAPPNPPDPPFNVWNQGVPRIQGKPWPPNAQSNYCSGPVRTTCLFGSSYIFCEGCEWSGWLDPRPANMPPLLLVGRDGVIIGWEAVLNVFHFRRPLVFTKNKSLNIGSGPANFWRCRVCNVQGTPGTKADGSGWEALVAHVRLHTSDEFPSK